MIGGTHFINGRWIEGSGERFASSDPATGEVNWEGRAAERAEISAAIEAAKAAFEAWAALAVSQRIDYLNRFAEQLRSHLEDMALAICRETGKPHWEAITEVQSMIAKVEISVEAWRDRRRETIEESAAGVSATRYKPHGVVAVLGPFNMPGHLPNGHIVPALLAGNCVVFKCSEATPLVGQKTAELWQAAGTPPGVFNMLQGGRETGHRLSTHFDLDGLFFTGSKVAGGILSRTFARRPGNILALEMGGNNPLVIWDANDLDAAAYLTIQSTFITSGQRCSCARRLIISAEKEGDALIERLIAKMKTIRLGKFTDDPEPFMGPVISDSAVEGLLKAKSILLSYGGVELVEMKSVGERPAMLSPGLIDMTGTTNRFDEEIFGPLLQVIRVKDFDAAIREANQTRYGLAAGLLSDDKKRYDQFYAGIRAGVVNWNRATTGASSRLPFGGIGLSGNHRPSGFWAADYCSYPIASMEQNSLVMPSQRTPGIDI